MLLNKLKRRENSKMEENIIDEIVNDTIKQIDEMPFGITEDEFETQEIIEEINIKVGDDDESTDK